MTSSFISHANRSRVQSTASPRRALRVLHVMPWFYPALVYGGPAQSVYDLARATARAGCEVRVLTTNANGTTNFDPGDEVPHQIDNHIQVTYCDRWFDDSISPELLLRLAGHIRWADVVHLGLTYSFPVLPTLALCRWYGKPVVWSPRGALQRYPYSRKRTLKALWESIARVLAPRNTVLHVTCTDEAAESTSRISCEAIVVPNGVDIPQHVIHRPSPGALRMIYLGRLHAKKGIENLLAACALLPGNLDWSLQIVGAGEKKYEDALRLRIAELSLDDRVQMRGLLVGDAKTRAFEHADLAVFPSYTENFGMVVAEALAHGVPVITSKGMPWSRVEEVGCGLWIDNDPQSVAAAILKLRNMPLRDMGQRGREWMERDFSWDSVAAQMLLAYERVIVEQPTRATDPLAESTDA